MFYLYCDRPTNGGIALIRALKGKRIKGDGSRFRPKRNRTVINWGSTKMMAKQILPPAMRNDPRSVATAVDKLRFFKSGIHGMLPPHTTDKEVARGWCKQGHKVVARTILNGHSGQGIVITGTAEKVPDAPLYTIYIPKDEEYRIHLIRDGEIGQTFYTQKKIKRADFGDKHNRLVRCFDNGYTYQHNDVVVPDEVAHVAKAVFIKTGLDFGAVDVIYRKKDNKAYVLEINTAPGLEGQSVLAYAEAFQKYFA